MNSKQKTFLTITTILIIAVIAAAAFFTMNPTQPDKTSIVATFYPLAFYSQEIGGEHVQVTQIVPNNTEIHSWEPSASHIVAADDADIIVYNGAGADQWLEDDVLPALSGDKSHVIVETTAGLMLLSGEDHEHENEAENQEHGSYDPHTWLSPYMAKLQAQKIYDALLEVDPENEAYYTDRWQSLQSRFEQLDQEYLSGLSGAAKGDVFVSHAAFGYLAHRYGFEQHGVIGLSADEQPSASTIANLVEMMSEHEVYVVYVDPVYSDEYAQTLKSEAQSQTGHEVAILELYLMLGPTDNYDYLSQMQQNLASLKTGLQTP
ncbi:MAG: zinc ABC transporter substrate-binding protein [Candidatus Bathyarchaeota archaeon]|nr:zinc ABC transporter substrate-binding protein [Candidatus Bathyarchaeota archaeon]